jgi:hypothetical protein
MRRYFAGILLILGMVAATAWADDFWVKKDWKEWTKADCKKMLEDSPWAKRFLVENTSSIGSLPSASRVAGGAGVAVVGAGEITYRVQIRSAEPIRQAIIRQEQLDKNYDKMSDAEKKTFDAQMDQQLSKFHGDVVAFHVIYDGNTATLKSSLSDYWQSFQGNSIPPDVFVVTASGARVPPISFISKRGPDSEFDLVFPRSSNNQPLVAPEAKSLKVQIKNPKIGDFIGKVVNAEFKLDKMTINGKLEF